MRTITATASQIDKSVISFSTRIRNTGVALMRERIVQKMVTE